MKALSPTGFFVILIFLLGSHAAQALTSQNLRCEYRTEPLGIDTAQPRLSWTSTSNVRGDAQTAYQVIVASSSSVLAGGSGDLWDSGQVASTQQNSVLYQLFVTHDLSGGQFTAAEDFTFPFRFRHGAVLPITNAEMDRLKAAYARSGL